MQPGVYLADFFSATSTSDNSMTRIASMDEFNVMAVGSSQHVSPSYAKTGVSRGLGLLELAHPTELRVEHWSSTTNLFGRPSYSGNPEWHARLHLTRMHGLSDELAARVAELEDVDYYDDTGRRCRSCGGRFFLGGGGVGWNYTVFVVCVRCLCVCARVLCLCVENEAGTLRWLDVIHRYLSSAYPLSLTPFSLSPLPFRAAPPQTTTTS